MMTASDNVKLLMGAFLMAFFSSALCQDTSTTTMATMAINSETTTSSMASMDTSTAACNEEEMQKLKDCCKPFMSVPVGDVSEMVRKAIEVENSRSNSTVWAFDSVVSAEKKDCVPAIYKIQAHLVRTRGSATNGTKTECRMKVRHHMLTKEETEDSQGNQELIIDEFCSGTSALSALYTLTAAALLGMVLHSMNFQD